MEVQRDHAENVFCPRRNHTSCLEIYLHTNQRDDELLRSDKFYLPFFVSRSPARRPDGCAHSRYTSFTSLLGEIKFLFEALADYCQDTVVFIVDSRKGICEQNLGSFPRI